MRLPRIVDHWSRGSAPTGRVPRHEKLSEATALHDAFRVTPETHRVDEQILVANSPFAFDPRVESALERAHHRIERAASKVADPAAVPNTLRRQMHEAEEGVQMLSGTLTRRAERVEHTRTRELHDDVLNPLRRGVVAVFERPTFDRDPDAFELLDPCTMARLCGPKAVRAASPPSRRVSSAPRPLNAWGVREAAGGGYVQRNEPGTDAAECFAHDDAAHARIVLDALRGVEFGAFEDLVRLVGADPLAELATSEHGAAWAGVPRQVIPADYRLAILHSGARLFRYDGHTPHLDGDLFESLVASLEALDGTWAEHAARFWRQLVLHVGEVSTVWPQARSLLARYPEQMDARPGLLGSIATLASTCGADAAADLWDRVLAHPALGDHAVRRWELELEWARCHLLIGGGEPARAMTVLQRVRSGFGDLDSASAQLAWTDATLELVCGLTWLGRAEQALRVIEDSLRRVEPGGELEAWIRGAGAYPAAAVGDEAGARAAAAAMQRAVTDTSSLQLRALIPARLIVAARHRNRDEIRAIARDAAAIESGRPLDPETRVAWRVHAAEAAVVAEDRADALAALAALDAALGRAPCDFSVHRLRRDNIELVLGSSHGMDAAPAHELERRATQLGFVLPDLSPAPAGGPVEQEPQHVLQLRVLGPFEVECDGTPIAEQLWAGRRQARLLLALLLVRGGRLSSDEVAEILWGDVDSRTARARIGPLCNSIRAVLGAAGASSPERELVMRGGSISLRLHGADHCDLQQLRDAARRVRREPACSRDLALAAISAAHARPIADLGTDRPATVIRQAIEHEVAQLIPRLAHAWKGQPAPRAVIDAVRHVFDADPTETTVCAELMCLLRDRGDTRGASAAFHRVRTSLRSELGLAPPIELVRLHSQIIGGDVTDVPEGAVAR